MILAGLLLSEEANTKENTQYGPITGNSRTNKTSPVWRILKKQKIEDPPIPLLGIYPEKMKTLI